jgi:DNA-binding NarL/FixJ family response regulator
MPLTPEIITLLLADDHPIALMGVRKIMENIPDFRVVGEAENGEEVRELVAKLRPRVLILDLKMPGTVPWQLEKWVRENFPGTVTLVLTAHDRDAYLSEMMKAGARGYLSKNERGENLIVAIRRAACGGSLFTEEQVQRALKWNRDPGVKWESLTKRERQVLALIEAGLENREISRRLSVGLKTIEGYVSNILKKLKVNSRGEARAWFAKNIPEELRENPE